jgi:hypothetical protein
VLVFHRSDWSIEVDALTWEKILEFFSETGWEPNVPTHRLLMTESITVDEESAHALAAAGRIVQEETLNDPIAAYSKIQFDMGTFAEIVEFASDGAFSVTRRD